jgi:hypothetical protein
MKKVACVANSGISQAVQGTVSAILTHITGLTRVFEQPLHFQSHIARPKVSQGAGELTFRPSQLRIEVVEELDSGGRERSVDLGKPQNRSSLGIVDLADNNQGLME